MHQKYLQECLQQSNGNNPNFITSRRNTLWCNQKVESLYTNKLLLPTCKNLEKYHKHNVEWKKPDTKEGGFISLQSLKTGKTNNLGIGGVTE